MIIIVAKASHLRGSETKLVPFLQYKAPGLELFPLVFKLVYKNTHSELALKMWQ